MTHLRPATWSDARLLWQWRNESVVRAVSFQQDVIPWQTHEEWLRRKLSLDSCRIWIFECDEQAAGQIRYEKAGLAAEVSFSVAPEFRGRGLAVAMLKMSAPLACRELHVTTLTGAVKTANNASLLTFERAGYAHVASGNEDIVRFELACCPAVSGASPVAVGGKT